MAKKRAKKTAKEIVRSLPRDSKRLRLYEEKAVLAWLKAVGVTGRERLRRLAGEAGMPVCFGWLDAHVRPLPWAIHIDLPVRWSRLQFAGLLKANDMFRKALLVLAEEGDEWDRAPAIVSTVAGVPNMIVYPRPNELSVLDGALVLRDVVVERIESCAARTWSWPEPTG